MTTPQFNLPTDAELKAGIRILMVLSEALKELGQVPNGEFYAHISDLIDFNTYMGAIRMLKQMKVLREENNVLIWVG